MLVENRRLKWLLVVALSALTGFLLGNLSPFSVRRFSPFEPSAVGSVEQVSFADVAQRVNASVVSVVSTKIVDLNQVHEDMEFWYPLRPEDESGKRKSLGFGSGFILEGRGLVVTNQHVIDDSRHIIVRLSDGSEYPAELIGADTETDLALMKIRPKRRLEAARLGNSDLLRVGDWVMAVGNPYNYEHSVTVGVVSAKDRKIDENPFERYIQTDAAINFGNSGGPLFNARGEVVAITTAISTKGRNIGFAIPMNFAKEIVGQLAGQGRVVRGFLGLTPEEITDNHARVLQLDSTRGVLVAEVSSRSAAEQAGIQRYDVITEIAGLPVVDRDDFRRKIAQATPGNEVVLKGIRNGKPVEFNAEIRERPSPGLANLRPAPEEPRRGFPQMGRAGISVQELTDQHRRTYRVDGSGVVIVEVDPISPAADAGLSVGDVILEINRHPVGSLLAYQKLITGFKANDALMLLVGSSRSRTRIVTLKLEARPQ
ncbi:MAG: trypsin-like peptidase domain-containing protein [Acidobacteria bacterium]|nr:trypsin-like peptidase domain-containing protein [Acidobacteriota bacterium]MCI0721203.1 trypsin-like peptidase domain-containing protein [Acidobacteriota bacterium]